MRRVVCVLSSEATRRALYDFVVAVHFPPPAAPVEPLEPAGPTDLEPHDWVPDYTPDQAGLTVTFTAGRWFARWSRLEEAESDLPEDRRQALVRIQPAPEAPYGVAFYLMRARHRLSKMLLRRDLRYAGRLWTAQHRAWLWSLKLEHAAETMVLEDYLLAVEQITTRLATLDAQLVEVAGQEPYRERVGWLRCFRGIDTITALNLVAELHGFERFQKPRGLMCYLGLVPSESSSGASVHRGPITKTGNGHLRRLLIEAAHHCRHRPGLGVKLRRRRVGQPAAVIALADRAQQRLHRRYSRLLLGRGLPAQKVVVACARELVGFVWALLYLHPHQMIAAGDEGSPRRRSRRASPTAGSLRVAAEKTQVRVKKPRTAEG